jgi:predicted nucleic acid-binding protein
VQAYERALLNSQQIRTLPIHVAVARQAILLRALYNIHVPDALQITTGIEVGPSLFVTNDRRLTSVEGIEILLLDDYAE